jgi:hypothetical protein
MSSIFKVKELYAQETNFKAGDKKSDWFVEISDCVGNGRK